MKDIFFFKLAPEPLIYLVFRLCTLYYFEPVTAWSLRILGRDYLYLVTIFDDIIYGNKLSVYFCSNHFITDSRMDAIRKVYRCRPFWKILYISRWCKCKYIVRKKIKVTL